MDRSKNDPSSYILQKENVSSPHQAQASSKHSTLNFSAVGEVCQKERNVKLKSDGKDVNKLQIRG